MAKIDFTAIEGWNDMTPEQKVSAMESYEIPEPDYSGYVPKAQFDKTASDLAKAKKDLRDTLSAEEQAKLDREQRQAELEKKYNDLIRESTISKNKAKFLGLGYEEKLAEETAIAVADGNMDVVFANGQKHLKAFEKSIRAEVLRNTPEPSGNGAGSSVMTLEKLRGMSQEDRFRFSQEHPQEYMDLYSAE